MRTEDVDRACSPRRFCIAVNYYEDSVIKELRDVISRHGKYSLVLLRQIVFNLYSK
jgi:hypothetical protein